MGQLRNIIVSVVALIILFFFVQTARSLGAPNVFTLVAALMVVLILLNVARGLIRGY